ncbi:hypothetical protein DSO57_1037422 [Entomophthora muscae]|uniref:Uncharacterized protein n=2 Tax=Entomophthora muscae TaxID=34485 RepID=A0ACC2SC24_9FUNG|nr:hypothetical protein DSO57_1037421 [Entomophthora muscae]KAJ9059833.1 hypothetical protein DSO57_1037422 [Entomophthora muscae]
MEGLNNSVSKRSLGNVQGVVMVCGASWRLQQLFFLDLFIQVGVQGSSCNEFQESRGFQYLLDVVCMVGGVGVDKVFSAANGVRDNIFLSWGVFNLEVVFY